MSGLCLTLFPSLPLLGARHSRVSLLGLSRYRGSLWSRTSPTTTYHLDSKVPIRTKVNPFLPSPYPPLTGPSPVSHPVQRCRPPFLYVNFLSFLVVSPTLPVPYILFRPANPTGLWYSSSQSSSFLRRDSKRHTYLVRRTSSIPHDPGTLTTHRSVTR